MHTHASELPLHGGLVEIANQIAEPHRHTDFISERLRTYDPVPDGLAVCPICHILRNKPSTLEALEDKSDDTSQYRCSRCGGRLQVGR